MDFVSVDHIGVVLHTIGSIYTIWLVVDAIHGNCIHQLNINGIIDYNLDAIDPITLEIESVVYVKDNDVLSNVTQATVTSFNVLY